MDYRVINDVLLSNKHISELEIKSNEAFNHVIYDWLIRCKLDVLDKWIPIVIGIPKYWELCLFDFYLVESNLPFIPHINNKGKLCLFNLEGVLICPDFEGVLNQCISKARNLIKEGILGENKKDFIREFDCYFNLLNDKLFGRVSLPVKKNNMNIKFCEVIHKNIRKNNALKRKVYNSEYFISTDSNDFFTWGRKETQKNGIYIHLNPDEYIYPPNLFDCKLEKFLNLLLGFIDVKLFNKLKNKCKNELLIVFEINQDRKNTSVFGFVIKNPDFSEFEDKLCLVSYKKIIPLSLNRIDVNYLSARTSFFSNKISDKSILLIGCGSIGGYVFHNLIKSGCRNITIIDNDKINPENIYRHFLGIESTDLYKVVALENYAKKTLPNLRIKSIAETIEDAINDADLDLNDFDYIISAIGSHTKNLWLNKYISENKILKTVFYIWNEPLDIGCHVARINIQNVNDYNNIFHVSDERILDLSSYVCSGQTFTDSYFGCNGTFIPYGSTLSIESSVLLLDLLKREVEKRINDNIIISKKGDDYYFKKAGFKVSNRYINQKEQYLEVLLSDLREDYIRCE